MIEITVFTPTYNRAYTLAGLYKSLCDQNYYKFEWLIVDDGSKDNTESLVREWIKEDRIPIQYYKKENGGKHTAINKGVELAQGKYFFIVDSDDYLVKGVLSRIEELFTNSEFEVNRYAGISGTKVFPDGSLIGSMFHDKEYVDCTALDRNNNNIRGDKAEVFFLEILKKYPFPIFPGEHFLNEAVVWNRIARDGYMMRWYNIPFIVCEYRNDGLTSQKGTLQYENPQGTLLYLEELAQNDKSIILKIAHRASFCGVAKGRCNNNEISKRLGIKRFTIPFYKLIFRIRGTN